jgi:hypothetical protein
VGVFLTFELKERGIKPGHLQGASVGQRG